jgi:phospholipase C
MKFVLKGVIAVAILATLPAQAQITAFKHIVVVVQENRTPDNLFLELCNQPPASCADTSNDTQYDIKTQNWKTVQGGTVTPVKYRSRDWLPPDDD